MESYLNSGADPHWSANGIASTGKFLPLAQISSSADLTCEPLGVNSPRISAVWRILSASLPDFMWLLLSHMVKLHCQFDGSWSDLGTFLWAGLWGCCQMSLEGPWMCVSWRSGPNEGRWWVELPFPASCVRMQYGQLPHIPASAFPLLRPCVLAVTSQHRGSKGRRIMSLKLVWDTQRAHLKTKQKCHLPLSPSVTNLGTQPEDKIVNMLLSFFSTMKPQKSYLTTLCGS